MAIGAACAEKNLLPTNGGSIPGLHGRLLLGIHPLIKRLLAFGNHHEAHMRVLKPAVLGAFTAIHARFVCLESQHVDATGNSVHLAMKLRYPEAVNNVPRLQYDLDWNTDRNMQLVGGRNALIAILHLPPP